MLLTLTGVLEDGTPRADNIPVNPRWALSFPIGTNLTLRLTIYTPDGNTVPLSTNSCTWTLKKSPADGTSIFAKTGLANGASIDFTLLPADTKQLSSGIYVYDIWYSATGVRNSVVPLSPLYLEAIAANTP
jgi:hypothetical protein